MGRLIILNDRQSGKTTSLLENFFRNKSECKLIIVANQSMKKHFTQNYLFEKYEIMTMAEFISYNGRVRTSQIIYTDIYIDDLFFMYEREARRFFEICIDYKLKNIKIFSTLNDSCDLNQMKTIKYLTEKEDFDMIDFRKNKITKEVTPWGLW